MKNEKFVKSSNLRPTSSAQMTRREFFKRMSLLGSGIIVYVSFGDPSSWAQPQADFNAFFRIGADGRITCFTGKIEMGQGIVTSLAQMLADELVLPLASVDMVMGDTLLCPYDRGTFGSLSTPYFGTTLRQAAAEARSVLTQMAAENLKVPPSQLKEPEPQSDVRPTHWGKNNRTSTETKRVSSACFPAHHFWKSNRPHRRSAKGDR